MANNRIKSDRGDAITVFFLFVLVMTAFAAVFILDFGKNVYMKNNYNQMAMRSAQTGLKQQNSVGGLTPAAADAVIQEYLTERDPGHINPMVTNEQDPKYKPNTAETAAFRTFCQAKNPELPIIKVSFSTERDNIDSNFSNTITYKNGETTYPDSLNDFYFQKYRTIRIEVQDIGDNYFYGMFGHPCQSYTIKQTAISIDADAGDTGI